MVMPRYKWECPLNHQKQVALHQEHRESMSGWILNHGIWQLTPTPRSSDAVTLQIQTILPGFSHGGNKIPGQQAALAGCLDANIEQYLYSVIGNNPRAQRRQNLVMYGLHLPMNHRTSPLGHKTDEAFQALPGTRGINGGVLQQNLRPGR